MTNTGGLMAPTKRRPRYTWQKYRCPDCDGPGRTQIHFRHDKYLNCFHCGVALVVMWDADGAGAKLSDNDLINELLEMGAKQVND